MGAERPLLRLREQLLPRWFESVFWTLFGIGVPILFLVGGSTWTVTVFLAVPLGGLSLWRAVRIRWCCSQGRTAPTT
jgi:hypothetical protein